MTRLQFRPVLSDRAAPLVQRRLYNTSGLESQILGGFPIGVELIPWCKEDSRHGVSGEPAGGLFGG